MNTQNYILYLTIENQEFILLKKDLFKIDEFTSFFKSKEAILSKLFEGSNYDYSNASISIKKEISNKNKIPIIGSDFREVSKIFNDKTELMKCLRKTTSIDVETLLSYFKLINEEQKINSKNNLILKIISELEFLCNKENNLYENRDEKYIVSTNLTYNIRRYCSNYENFRKFYTYFKGLGFFFWSAPLVEKEEKEEFDEILEYIKNNLLLFLSDLEERRKDTHKFRNNLQEDANVVGVNLLKKSKKSDLQKEAKGYALRKAKKDNLISEAKDLGRRLSDEKDEEFTLEYQSDDVNIPFKDYLDNYYKTQGSDNSVEIEGQRDEEYNTLVDLEDKLKK